MLALLVFEATMAFVVLCADAEPEPVRPRSHQVLRSLCWPATVGVWCTHRSTRKLARLGATVWFLVTTGWLLSLEQDRAPSGTAFLVMAQATMAVVVWCVDALSPDLHGRPGRRLLRCAVWPVAVVGYLAAADSLDLLHASLVVWIALTCGWLLTLQHDRFFASLGTVAAVLPTARGLL